MRADEFGVSRSEFTVGRGPRERPTRFRGGGNRKNRTEARLGSGSRAPIRPLAKARGRNRVEVAPLEVSATRRRGARSRTRRSSRRRDQSSRACAMGRSGFPTGAASCWCNNGHVAASRSIRPSSPLISSPSPGGEPTGRHRQPRPTRRHLHRARPGAYACLMRETEGAAIVMRRYGGPEVLHVERVRLPALLPGEIRVRAIASAVTRGPRNQDGQLADPAA